MAFFSHVYRSEFWNPGDRWFFQLILICFIHTYSVKVKNPMDFFVRVGKTRSTLCAIIAYYKSISGLIRHDEACGSDSQDLYNFKWGLSRSPLFVFAEGSKRESPESLTHAHRSVRPGKKSLRGTPIHDLLIPPDFLVHHTLCPE